MAHIPRPVPAEGRSGWLAFVGVMLAIVGALNFVYGVAAISGSNFFVGAADYIVSDLDTYGWVLLVTGAVQFASALSVWSGASSSRWVGGWSSGVNALAHVLFIPAYPLAALALFAVDILVIYGLLAHGGGRRAA